MMTPKRRQRMSTMDFPLLLLFVACIPLTTAVPIQRDQPSLLRKAASGSYRDNWLFRRWPGGHSAMKDLESTIMPRSDEKPPIDCESSAANTVPSNTPASSSPNTIAPAPSGWINPWLGPVVYESAPVTLASSPISVSVMPPATQDVPSGTVASNLQTSGRVSSQPFPTSAIATSDATLSPTSLSTSAPSPDTTPAAGNIFVPIANDGLPSQITTRGDHPVKPIGVISGKTSPVTNKFYANLMLGTQLQPAWVLPYVLQWAAGVPDLGSKGMAITHADLSQFVYGDGDPAKYFVGPTGIGSLVFSAAELGSQTVLTTSDHTAFSARVNLAPSGQQAVVLTMPLVQGIGLVTGMYTASTPLIQSGFGFKQLSALIKLPGSATWKCNVQLQDGSTWLIYITPHDNTDTAPPFTLQDPRTITGPSNWAGMVQVARLTGGGTAEAAYDASAGVYAVDASIYSPPSTGGTASYSLTWAKGGQTSRKLVMFALPHHHQSFDAATKGAEIDGALLQTPTKGMARLVAADSWTMIESLPISMSFAPWSPTFPNVKALPPAAMSLVNATAAIELSEDMNAQTNLDSMYFSGKGLAKFATLVYTAHDLAQNPGIAAAGLTKLKAALNVFVQNKQIHPLVYDPVWRGVVSSAGYGDVLADFGNTAYNDHNFHYGYFVYTAAVIATIDPSWLTQGANKVWINMLVRDYANSATDDALFPFSRSFDWYHGHSWAKGLFESSAGKDQESSSEDSFASFAIKMWGKAIGDGSMEARGNLMLAVQARSFNNYYYMQSNNDVQPKRYIDNKVVGILFEGKADHTTYFGTNIEYIEGIHMLPLAPNTGLTRPAAFVREEWDKYFSNGRADVAGGWRGILYANLAFIDPKASWNFFAQDNFDNNWLDGGASRAWYLALAAALGGVS